MKSFRNFGALILALSFLAAAAFAQPAPRPAAAQTQAAAVPARQPIAVPPLPYEKYKLKNGLEIILSEDHRLPLVAVDLWYHVGPANERPGLTGFAHLFEHMMFQGSKHVGNRQIPVLEAAGVSDYNGTTDFDRTNYFETVPVDQLDLALWLESDRMGWLLDDLNEAKLANQRDVVRNERRQSVENEPYGIVEEEMFHQLFPPGHPYYADVIGSHADIESANLKDIRDFFKLYYAPNNASLAIVGDIDKAKVKQAVEKYFGSIPSGPPVPKITATTPPITAQKRVVVQDQVELPRVYLAWLTPAIFKPGDADADLLAQLLGGGKSSRLYKKLVYDKQIAQDVQVGQQSLMLGSVFTIDATCKQGVKPEDIEKAIDEELRSIQQQGPTAAELDRARNKIQTRLVEGLQRLGGFGGIADQLNAYNHYLGNPGYLPQDLARYENATPASVQKLAQSLTSNSEVVVYAEPGQKVLHDIPKRQETEAELSAKAEPSGSPAEAWRDQPPAPAKEPAFTLPKAEQFKLDNGLTVLLVEQHKLPVVAANLVVLRGSDSNPPDRPGLASFTSAMLQEGTQDRPALQLADDVDQLGATLSTTSAADYSAVAIRGLKRNAQGEFDLLSDVVLHPAFREPDVERLRKQRLTALLQERDSPPVLSRKVLYSSLYGPKNPYGYLESGTRESTVATTRDDLVNFWKQGYVPGDSALVLAGDLTVPEARDLANKYFGSWSGAVPSHQLPSVGSNLQARIVIVDKPGAPQTFLRAGNIAMPRSSSDWVAAQVLNAALGGMFSSRINMNLREKHGYTYGAGSIFLERRGTGPFYASAPVRTDVTGPAVSEMFKELRSVRDAPLSPEELATAKENEARALPGLFETDGRTAAAVANLFVYGLPLDYYSGLPAKIDAVTAQQAQEIARKYIHPDAMVLVAVGDRKKIEPELNELKLGPVETVDVADKPPAGGQ